MSADPSSFASLRGRTAVVTGASSGIGAAIARELAHAGANVAIGFANNKTGAEDTAACVRDCGGDARIFAADFRDGVDGFLNDVFAWKDGVDIWVNNAGADVLTGPAAYANFAEKLDALWEVDVRAGMLLAKAAGERMRETGGVILTIGWDQAAVGMEGDSGELFAATKNAVMGFTRSLAVSLAPQVRVNCIAPGWIKTAWGESASDEWQQRVLRETPMNRWGTPQDIARLARFLASEDASFITGQVINVNGGAIR